MKNISPVQPFEYDETDCLAIQALSRGEADAVMQQRVLDFIINKAGTYDLSFRPESTRETDFAEGKRFIGLQIVKLLKIDVNMMRRNKNVQVKK